MSQTELKVCRVHWQDHSSVNGWKTLSDIPASGYRVESVGWLVNENDEVVVLATSIGEAKAADFTIILKSCIDERYEL